MKTVLITGASRGIGRATAEKFLAEDWQVIGTSTSGRFPFKPDGFVGHRLDLADPKSIESFARALDDSDTRLDVLINNAAVALDDNESRIIVELLRRTIEVNLFGTIDLTERLLPLVNDGGHIVNVSSGSGSMADYSGVWAPAYMISKASLNMYTRILADNLRERKIIVSAIRPGWVRTDMGGPEADRAPEEAADDIFKLATSRVDSGHFWSRGKKRAW